MIEINNITTYFSTGDDEPELTHSISEMKFSTFKVHLQIENIVHNAKEKKEN